SGRQLSRCLQPDLVQHYSKINQTFRLNVIAARVLSLHLKESFWHCGKVLTVHLTFFFSSRRRHTRWPRDWSSDVCSSDLKPISEIGMILLIGLVSKNSILLVEYTNQLKARGLDTVSAVLEAGRIRLRPILMTSVATIMGAEIGRASCRERVECLVVAVS